MITASDANKLASRVANQQAMAKKKRIMQILIILFC